MDESQQVNPSYDFFPHSPVQIQQNEGLRAEQGSAFNNTSFTAPMQNYQGAHNTNAVGGIQQMSSRSLNTRMSLPIQGTNMHPGFSSISRATNPSQITESVSARGPGSSPIPRPLSQNQEGVNAYQYPRQTTMSPYGAIHEPLSPIRSNDQTSVSGMSNASMGSVILGQQPQRSTAESMRFDPSEFPALGNVAMNESEVYPRRMLHSPMDQQTSHPSMHRVQSPQRFPVDDFPALPGQTNASADIPQLSTVKGNPAHPRQTVNLRTSTPLSTTPLAVKDSVNQPKPGPKQQITIGESKSGQSSVEQKMSLSRQYGSPNAVTEALSVDRFTTGNETRTIPPRNGSSPSFQPVSSSQTRPRDNEELQTQYGLLGLLPLIRGADPDLNTLALGIDLTMLGFDLNSKSRIYSTFASPWSDSPTIREPHYIIPRCYSIQSAPKTAHFPKFQLETLFYIFYSMPNDVLQVHAAQELYGREWRFHKETKLWLKRISSIDGPNSQQSPQYLYFNIHVWEQRPFPSPTANIASSLATEEEIRMKPHPGN